VIATAILDRLLHRSTTISTRGESYWLKERRRDGPQSPPRKEAGEPRIDDKTPAKVATFQPALKVVANAFQVDQLGLFLRAQSPVSSHGPLRCEGYLPTRQTLHGINLDTTPVKAV